MNELSIMAGQVGLNKPYRAPIYQTYWECMQGLYRQGILGFYKGNLMRLSHIAIYGQWRDILIYYAYRDKNILTSRSNFFVDLAAATFASICLHPFHYAESRMVLNNRLPNFGSYKSLFSLLISS